MSNQHTSPDGVVEVSIAHSPDSDDAFMFYGLATQKVRVPGYRFTHTLCDIETLNQRAQKEAFFDITAISFHAYPYLQDNYTLMGCGGSVGEGYGPMVVAKNKYSLEDLEKITIAIPGTMTTAYLALKIFNPKLKTAIVPFDKIIPAVLDGTYDAGLIIHEGQLTYQNEGLVVCEDLGVWWGKQNDGLPLPLGGNVIHKRFAPATRRSISDTLTASIQYSLDHRPEAVQHALQYARDMGRELADKFVGMYVNHWTLDYGERGRESIRRFLGQAFERGIIPHRQELEFVV